MGQNSPKISKLLLDTLDYFRELILVPPKLLLSPTIYALLPKYSFALFLSYWHLPHPFLPLSLSSFLSYFSLFPLSLRYPSFLRFFFSLLATQQNHDSIMYITQWNHNSNLFSIFWPHKITISLGCISRNTTES